MKTILLNSIFWGLTLTGCTTLTIEGGSKVNQQKGTYEINGAKVTEKEYLTLKDQLNVSSDIIDERYPNGLGYGATWTATHKKTKEEYKVSESMFENTQSYSINLKKE